MATHVIDFNNVEKVVFNNNNAENLVLNGVSIWSSGFKKLDKLIDRTLDRVVLEDFASINNIESHAFARCRNLVYVEIPSTVSVVSGYAFLDCENLSTIRFFSEDPPTLGLNAFPTQILTTLEVPNEYLDTYLNDSGWSLYKSRIVGV